MESVNYITSEGKERENADFFDNKHQEKLKKIKQLKINQKKEDELESTKLKILFFLEDFWIKREDFELVNKDWTLVIISNSSYFSSIVGLNWIQEKEKSRDSKDRNKYDTFDNKFKDLLSSNLSKSEAQTQLKEYCKENNLDFESIITWWGCVISEWEFLFVWIKRAIWSSKDVIEENEWTITHEGQHIKFKNYCRERWIEQNWTLKLLNEVIAHCTNTKNNKWDIDFEKIFEVMKDNENYLYVSWIQNKTRYELVLKDFIEQVKREMLDKDLDDTMKYLIEQNK